MAGDSRFTFKGTRFTRFTVTVGSTGARIEYASSAEGVSYRYAKAWDIVFADVELATVYEWRTQQVEGEAIYLHCRRGGTPMVMTSPAWRAAGYVSNEDRATYFAATAALFRALAAARPETRVRNGRPRGWRTRWTLYLTAAAAIVSGLFLWQTGDGRVDDSFRATGVAAIIAMTALYGVYRTKLLAPVKFAGIGDVADWMSKRAPAVGPWGAVPTAT
jgi:hypothetical protein